MCVDETPTRPNPTQPNPTQPCSRESREVYDLVMAGLGGAGGDAEGEAKLRQDFPFEVVSKLPQLDFAVRRPTTRCEPLGQHAPSRASLSFC